MKQIYTFFGFLLVFAGAQTASAFDCGMIDRERCQEIDGCSWLTPPETTSGDQETLPKAGCFVDRDCRDADAWCFAYQRCVEVQATTCERPYADDDCDSKAVAICLTPATACVGASLDADGACRGPEGFAIPSLCCDSSER